MRPLPLVAFENANLVPMYNAKVFHDRVVVVQGSRIVDVGRKNAVKIPSGTPVIDCLGTRYLIPGLADMHVHAWNEPDLLLFVANGVTTIRNMWGGRLQLGWKKRIDKGALLGPTIYTAGPLLDGDPPIWKDSKVIKNPREAKDEVPREKRAGYDFVKVYNRLSPGSYRSIVTAAKKCGMQVAGHVPDAVGLAGVLEARQDSIEHLDGYLLALKGDGSPSGKKVNLNMRYGATDEVDRRKISRIVRATLDASVSNCVTLVVFQKWVSKEDARKLLEEPAMRFVRPELREEWNPSTNLLLKERSASDIEAFRKADRIRKEVVGAMSKAGAKVLLGTDTPNPLVVPGFSIHEELDNLVDAGMSPYEAIRAGTKDAATFLGAADEFGTIEPGKRADLILTEANPLEDVRNISRRAGVMLRGKWFPEAELRRMLENLAASYVALEAQ